MSRIYHDEREARAAVSAQARRTSFSSGRLGGRVAPCTLPSLAVIFAVRPLFVTPSMALPNGLRGWVSTYAVCPLSGYQSRGAWQGETGTVEASRRSLEIDPSRRPRELLPWLCLP